MIRECVFNNIEKETYSATKDFIVACEKNMVHEGDLLVCQQNGSFWGDNPMIGLGDVLEYALKLNRITAKGIQDYTQDDNYFKNNGNAFFDGTSEIEETVNREFSKYLNIWENFYFLRVLTQLVHLLNGEHYDWDLDIVKATNGGKNKSQYLEEKIIKKLGKAESFQKLIKEAYDRKIRNAIAHSQCVFASGGFMLMNIPPHDGIQDGLSFEQWERKYVLSYQLLVYIKRALEGMTRKYFSYTQFFNKPIPIIVPIHGEWEHRYLFPNSMGTTWRFLQ